MPNILISGDKGFVGLHMGDIPHVGYDLLDGLDILNKYQLETCFANNNIDVVIHLAAYAGVHKSVLFPEDYFNTNIQGTQNVIEACKRHNVKHLIFFSSSSVYGNGQPPLKETDELNPISPYGISKVAGELLVKSSGVPYTIVRPFSLYGDKGRKDQIFYKWINQIKAKDEITLFGDGTAKRGFTNVYDLVDAVKLILERGAENETYNIGGDEVISMEQVIGELKKSFDFKINLLPENKGDIDKSWADISKARDKLYYKPKRKFFEELQAIIKNI